MGSVRLLLVDTPFGWDSRQGPADMSGHLAQAGDGHSVDALVMTDNEPASVTNGSGSTETHSYDSATPEADRPPYGATEFDSVALTAPGRAVDSAAASRLLVLNVRGGVDSTRGEVGDVRSGQPEVRRVWVRAECARGDDAVTGDVDETVALLRELYEGENPNVPRPQGGGGRGRSGSD